VLLLKLCNLQLRLRRILQQVDSTLSMISQRLLQHNNSSVTPQNNVVRNKTIRKITVNATLRVTMVFRTARISSLLSKMSSYQGVSFQSISRRDNLGLDREELGTCAPDVLGPFGAWSIWAWSLTRSFFSPAGITLMGSTPMTRREVDILTSPIAPRAPASATGGGVVVLESAAGDRVTPLHRQLVEGSPSSRRQPATAPQLHGQATLYEKVRPKHPGCTEAPQPTYKAHHRQTTSTPRNNKSKVRSVHDLTS
jgi:hypothetical protein